MFIYFFLSLLQCSVFLFNLHCVQFYFPFLLMLLLYSTSLITPQCLYCFCFHLSIETQEQVNRCSDNVPSVPGLLCFFLVLVSCLVSRFSLVFSFLYYLQSSSINTFPSINPFLTVLSSFGFSLHASQSLCIYKAKNASVDF